MKVSVFFLSILLCINYFIPGNATALVNSYQGPAIGGKMRFEEQNGGDYLGTREINRITRTILHDFLDIKTDICAPNAKILLFKKDDKVMISHYEERSMPGVGEEMHNTLLYTKPRGFCNSETIEQVCDALFDNCGSSQSIESVAQSYNVIIKPEWRFTIARVVLHEAAKQSFISAKLLFEGKNRLYKDDKPISALLSLTLVNCKDSAILLSDGKQTALIEALNEKLKGERVKVAIKNGIADLEFGISGETWRIRAGERFNIIPPKQ